MLILLLSAAAFVAAMINAAPGGGTFITFPILTTLARLTEKAANITSTLGLLMGTSLSIAYFVKADRCTFREFKKEGIVEVLKGLVGWSG